MRCPWAPIPASGTQTGRYNATPSLPGYTHPESNASADLNKPPATRGNRPRFHGGIHARRRPVGDRCPWAPIRTCLVRVTGHDRPTGTQRYPRQAAPGARPPARVDRTAAGNETGTVG